MNTIKELHKEPHKKTKPLFTSPLITKNAKTGGDGYLQICPKGAIHQTNIDGLLGGCLRTWIETKMPEIL